MQCVQTGKGPSAPAAVVNQGPSVAQSDGLICSEPRPCLGLNPSLDDSRIN